MTEGGGGILRAVRGWRLLVVPWVLAALALAGGVGVEFWSGSLESGGERLPPLVERAAWALALAAAASIIWALFRVIRRVRPRMRSDFWRIFSMAGLVLAHLLAVPGVLVGAMLADPGFPFGSTYQGSIRSPHGSTVYLYSGGLFCQYEVYERASGAFYLQRRFTISPDRCVDKARLSWNSHFDEPVVLGPDGKQIVQGTAFERAFDWAPH